MLHLILGRAGTGKTAWLHEQLRSFVLAGHSELILLVPEQDSFAHERALLNLLGEQQAGAVEVLSFTRLADSLFRACGGRCGRVGLSDAQRALAMSLALDAVRDKLTLFAQANERMVPGLLRLRRELSMAGTAPDDFLAVSQHLGQAKLCELARIMQAYDALLESSFGGHCDAMQGLHEALGTPEGRAFLSGKIVAVDAFLGFTPQELRILGRVLEHSAAVYVTLCLDQLHGNDTDVFAHTRRTAADLRALAREANIPIAAPATLTETHRFLHNDLAQLEACFTDHSIHETACEAIRLCVCEDIEAECALAAARIKALLREGFRCRNIAVLARDAARYEQPLFAALRRVGVPLFEDRRQPVAAQPLMRMAAAAFEIAEEGFTLEAVMRWLKAGLTPCSEEDIALLEDYALLWRVNGNRWLSEWQAHPQGLGQPENEHSDLHLARLNALRERVVTPLAVFRESMRDCTGLGGAVALDALLQAANVPTGLKQLRANLLESEKTAEALELSRVWDLLMQLLDQMAQSLGEQAIGAARFRALFELVLSLQSLGQLPQSLDAVTFGSAERVRLQSPRAVFVLGMNDGVFPRRPVQESLVSERERAALAAAGLRMQDQAPEQLAMERIIVYRSLTAARERLHISWALRNSAGEELRPSGVLHWLREHFPALQTEDAAFLPPLERLEGESAAFALLCEERARQSELYAALHSYFAARPNYAPRLAALERMANERPDSLQIATPEAAMALFRGVNYLSPSRVESYARCPFQYFCRYGLKAQARRPVDFDPLLRGNILHHLFEQLFSCHEIDALLELSPDQRQALLNGILSDYAAEHLSAEQLPARVTYMFNRLREIAAQVFERMLAEFCASPFRPAACELRIDMDQAIKPYEVPLPGGDVLRLGGMADRVDCAEIDQQRYFRVVDYKSGSKAFSLGHVFEGLNLQLPVYLFALQHNNYENALPAGVLYSPVRDPVLSSAERGRTAEEIARDKQRSTKPDGFAIDHPGNCKLDLLPRESLPKLQQELNRVLASMAQQLRAGEIPALPLQDSEDPARSICAWCDYRAICGREANGAAKHAANLKFDEALALLNERYPDAL